jgi:hypothetical protein
MVSNNVDNRKNNLNCYAVTLNGTEGSHSERFVALGLE